MRKQCSKSSDWKSTTPQRLRPRYDADLSEASKPEERKEDDDEEEIEEHHPPHLITSKQHHHLHHQLQERKKMKRSLHTTATTIITPRGSTTPPPVADILHHPRNFATVHTSNSKFRSYFWPLTTPPSRPAHQFLVRCHQIFQLLFPNYPTQLLLHQSQELSTSIANQKLQTLIITMMTSCFEFVDRAPPVPGVQELKLWEALMTNSSFVAKEISNHGVSPSHSFSSFFTRFDTKRKSLDLSISRSRSLKDTSS
ncbi:hypothetical protein Cantr_03557 [Candida viswanathii]|uniref:Uncharacterized protein n=1 Tax=Candida viswanathii TaxID=5486 RepID=A0A367YL09_9ASCO|nr:hypothetical protein Cantr_03557 [Candida viswanathii]